MKYLTFSINMASGLAGIISDSAKIITESSFLIHWF